VLDTESPQITFFFIKRLRVKPAMTVRFF